MKNFQLTIVIATSLLACSTVGIPFLGELVTDIAGGFGQVISSFPSALAAAKNTYKNLPTTAQINYDKLTAVLTRAAAGESSSDEIFAFLFNGLYIAQSPTEDASNSSSVGPIPLLLDPLCTVDPAQQLTICYVCNADCFTAHNLWGGKCGPSPINQKPTCLCAESPEEATARNIVPDSSTTCSPYNPFASIGEPAFLSDQATRIRSLALQCIPKLDGTYEEAGCVADCVQNHGFVSGSCQIQKPNVPMPAGTYPNGNDEPTRFCVCSHNNQPNTTFSVASTSG